MKFFKKTTVLLLLLLIIVSPVIAHAKELEIGMSFFTARKFIMSKGWQPINAHEGEEFPYLGTGKELINKHIIEVENCFMDRPGCVFNYKKGDKCLRLFTQGEEIIDLHVSYWTYDCLDGSVRVQTKTPTSGDKKKFEMGKPLLDNGEPFLTARKSLINNGWRPILTKPVYGATEKILIDANIKEVESCAMDIPGCIFNYKKGKVCLRLFTEGEEIKNMRVNYWLLDCADGD